MKISKETLDVLKNFSAINPNLVLKEGNVLSTIAEAKNIMATTTVAETFPKEVGIYDLNEFLSALSLIEDSDLEFGESAVLISSPMSSITYRYADKSILTSPEKAVNMPEPEVTINLSADDIAHIRRAGSALGHPVVAIISETDDDNIYLEVKDPNNSSANTFRLNVGYSGNAVFDFRFLIANLKLIPGNYQVSVSSKLISHWACNINNNPIEYWIALEKSSTYTSV
jgi:hypothetical protein